MASTTGNTGDNHIAIMANSADGGGFGFRQRIAKAETQDAAQQLLHLAQVNCPDASKRTKVAWQRTYERRCKELAK